MSTPAPPSTTVQTPAPTTSTAATTTAPAQTTAPATQTQAPTATTTVPTTPQVPTTITIDPSFGPELTGFLSTLSKNKEIAQFSMIKSEEAAQTEGQRREEEKKIGEQKVKEFIQFLPNIYNLYNTPSERRRVEEAEKNIRTTPENISASTLNTAILTVKACQGASTNLSFQEQKFQQDVFASQSTLPVKKAKIEDLWNGINSPFTLSVNPETVIPATASAPTTTQAPPQQQQEKPQFSGGSTTALFEQLKFYQNGGK